MASKLSEVVLVGVADLFDDAVEALPFEEPGDLRGPKLPEMLAQRTVAETLDQELAAAEDLEERLIVIVEEVEAAIVVLVLFDRVGESSIE